MLGRVIPFDALPLEVWEEVVAQLPRSDRRVYMSVSRMFHNLAIRSLFASITICFGAWECRRAEEDDWVVAGGEARLQALEDSRSAMSAEIIQRIISDASFAGMLTNVEVHAYKLDGYRAAFEIRSLVGAIRCMHNLRSFVWRGDRPAPSAEVIEALSRSCRMLRTFSAPLFHLSKLPLDKLDTLRSVGFTWACFDDGSSEQLSDAECGLQLAPDLLRELRIPFDLPSDVALPSFPTLTHLELVSINSGTLEGLCPLLRATPLLESLSLVPPEGEEDILAEMLDSLRSSLPNLAAFRLLPPSHPPDPIPTGDQTQALANFLRGRTRLRRLCAHRDYWHHRTPFLSAIATLKNLEAFHVTLHSENIGHPLVDLLVSHLSPCITAIDIATEGSVDDLVALARLWCYFKNLRFFYLRTWGSPNTTVQQVICGVRSLRTVGFNGAFYDVKWDKEQCTCISWSERRLAFRTADDFHPACEAGEWLMKHYHIAPERLVTLPALV